MEFKQKLKQRLYIAVSYIVLGLILIIADVLNQFENRFIFAFGLGLLVYGTHRILHYRKITRDEKLLRKQELFEKDERYQMLSERAKSWAFSFSLMAVGFVVIVLSFLGYQDQAMYFAWYVCGQTLLYWIFWIILGKKY